MPISSKNACVETANICTHGAGPYFWQHRQRQRYFVTWVRCSRAQRLIKETSMVIWVPLPNRCRQCARGLQNGHLGKQTGSQTHPTDHPLFEYKATPCYQCTTRRPEFHAKLTPWTPACTSYQQCSFWLNQYIHDPILWFIKVGMTGWATVTFHSALMKLFAPGHCIAWPH